MTAPDGTPLDGGVHEVTIEGGRHAIVRHKGPYVELEGVYRWIYGTWLPGSGHEPADRPCFEQYVNSPRDAPLTEWLTDIFVPLKD